MANYSPKETNGYSNKEITVMFVLPEIRELSAKFDEFLCEDYKPFKETTNKWRLLLTGAFLFVTTSLTILGTLSIVLGNLDVI